MTLLINNDDVRTVLIVAETIAALEGAYRQMEILLAVEREEVQGACGLSCAVFTSQYSSWMSKGFVTVLVQEDADGDPELNRLGVPLVIGSTGRPNNADEHLPIGISNVI